MKFSMFTRGQKCQVRRPHADNILAFVVPFFSARRFLNKKMMNTNLFLYTRIPDSSVSPFFVQNVAGPVPATFRLINMQPKPVINRHIVWAAITCCDNRAIAPCSFIMHETNAAIDLMCRMSFTCASVNLANLDSVSNIISRTAKMFFRIRKSLLDKMALNIISLPDLRQCFTLLVKLPCFFNINRNPDSICLRPSRTFARAIF